MLFRYSFYEMVTNIFFTFKLVNFQGASTGDRQKRLLTMKIRVTYKCIKAKYENYIIIAINVILIVTFEISMLLKNKIHNISNTQHAADNLYKSDDLYAVDN